jgi:hypothetical protein
MPRTVIVMLLSVAMLATVGFADTNTPTTEPGSSPVVLSTPAASPAPMRQTTVPGNAGPVIRWEKFYDRQGNLLAGDPGDNVGADSLYFKIWGSMDTLFGCPKSEVPDPTPANCRPGFSYLDNQTRVGMDPQGTYIYEVDGTALRRHNTSNGTFTNFTVSNGNSCCKTDGDYLFVPVGNVVYKYSLTGSFEVQTTLDITPLQYVFSLVNDTVWCGTNSGTLSGYACSKFAGGSITPDATWDLGPYSGSGVQIGWDGTYYYAGWNGSPDSNTFKRFNADRTVSASGTIYSSPFAVMSKEAAPPLMIVSTDGEAYRAELAETLEVASGGVLNSIGTYDVEVNATFPATEWYNDGCRVILEFSGSPFANDPVLLGDSLAQFVDLGGRVVTAVWADAGAVNLAGRYVSQYMPFTSQTNPGVAGSMGTVHDPLHPIMDGVTAIAVTDYITGNTHSTLRSSNCVCLAEWDSDNRSVAAYLDSADVRLASVGFAPFTVYSGMTGQWARLLANAILWVWPGMPAVTVTAPDTGDVWDVGSSHDITWTAANGPITKDSIVHSNDNGATWNFVDKYSGSRTSYTWTIPNSPSTDCHVRVFAWNAIGSAAGTSGRFAVQAAGIAQDRNNALPLAFSLYQSGPNPLASGTAIRYALPRRAQVELHVYDVTGSLVRRLVDGVQPAGYTHVYWNGCDDRGGRVAPGVYYCRLQAGDFAAAQKLVVRR